MIVGQGDLDGDDRADGAGIQRIAGLGADQFAVAQPLVAGGGEVDPVGIADRREIDGQGLGIDRRAQDDGCAGAEAVLGEALPEDATVNVAAGIGLPGDLEAAIGQDLDPGMDLAGLRRGVDRERIAEKGAGGVDAAGIDTGEVADAGP
jgi:hypothetical protein